VRVVSLKLRPEDSAEDDFVKLCTIPSDVATTVGEASVRHGSVAVARTGFSFCW
jgi:hypothetical protein